MTPNFRDTEIRFLDRNPPTVSVEEIRRVAKRHYDLSGEFRCLPSERDQNFRVDTDRASRFVVKIANENEDAEVVDFQLGALLHIATQDPLLPVPRVLLDADGMPFRIMHCDDGNDHIVYVLHYLDGSPMSVASGHTSPALRRKLGVLMAKIDTALRGYFHPAARQQHPWNIETCTRFIALTEYVQRTDDRLEIDKVFTRMSESVIPQMRALRHQVIHQDAHADNVIVSSGPLVEIGGLIDFGDLLYGTLAAEVAIVCDGAADSAQDMVSSICEVAAGYDSALALEEEEIELVFDLISARNALTATIVAARQALTADQPAHIASSSPFVDRLRHLNQVGRREFERRIRAACRFPAYCPRSTVAALPDEEEAGLVQARQSLMGRNATHLYDRPIHFERALGPWLFATDGKRYLDCYNNVSQVGHCHPHVVKAIARQAAALNTNTRYLYSSALEYAERLTAKLAPHLTACIFVNSGSEANDIAWQMAKLLTGKRGAAIMEDAYHGVTDVIRQFSPGHPDTQLPDFLQGVIVPDPYRGPYRHGDADLVQKYAADADRAIAQLESAGHGVAAFMVDSAMCSSGVPEIPAGYLRAVEEKIRAAGGLMVCDEVQSGFGRMGQWWGHEHHGVRADIVTMGKPVGNGHPLGVVVTSGEILNLFIDEVRLFSTFGGNTVACAAGNAVLDVIEQEDLIQQGAMIGDYLRSQIESLASKHELIGDVRGHGMVSGLEFVNDRAARTPATRETATLLELMRERCVLVGSEGRDANILKLRPSLLFNTEHVDVFIDALDRSLAAL